MRKEQVLEVLFSGLVVCFRDANGVKHVVKYDATERVFLVGQDGLQMWRYWPDVFYQSTLCDASNYDWHIEEVSKNSLGTVVDMPCLMPRKASP
jgi:hypothetical protein